MPHLKKILFLFEYGHNYENTSLGLVGLGLKQYHTPIKINISINTFMIIPELKFLKTVDIYPTIESQEILVSSPATFSHLFLNQMSIMKNLKNLIVRQEALEHLNDSSDDMSVSKIVCRVSRLTVLEELVLLIGDYERERGFKWYLAKSLKYLKTSILRFKTINLPEDLNIFNSVTHLEISMNHGDLTHDIAPPFSNLTSLGLYGFLGSSLSIVQKMVDSNKRLVNLSINDSSQDMYPKLSPLLYRIKNLECYDTVVQVDSVMPEFLKNPPIHYIPQQSLNIRSLCLPFAKIGIIKFQTVLNMAKSIDVCPKLSTIYCYEATGSPAPFKPSDLFLEAYQEKTKISDMLPNDIFLEDFCVPVVPNKTRETQKGITSSCVIEVGRLREMLEI